jgi:hypothetical protein
MADGRWLLAAGNIYRILLPGTGQATLCGSSNGFEVAGSTRAKRPKGPTKELGQHPKSLYYARTEYSYDTW